jgi:hypothetical protein
VTDDTFDPRLGTLKRITPRKLWPTESGAFTPWLAQHLDILGQVLGMDLELVGMEGGVGAFAVDIIARDLGTGHTIVIENQFSSTDHDHLGKLLTYAAGLDAYAVIWIAEKIREEHRQTLEWLNQRTSSDTVFFGVVVELLQIDNSQPAVNFDPVVFPNEWQKSKRTSPPGTSLRGEAYRAFFQPLLDELREKHRFTRARAAQATNWYSFASGFQGITYGLVFRQTNQVCVELYIDVGDETRNKGIFHAIQQDRDRVEAEVGAPLQWERLDNRRASRVASYRKGSIEDSDAELAAIRGWAVPLLLRFKKVFDPRIKVAIKEVEVEYAHEPS